MKKWAIYSFCGSKFHFGCPVDVAEAYNRAIDEWFNAQRRFKECHGRAITVEELVNGGIKMKLTNREYIAYNAISNFMNTQYENGLVLKEEDCTENHLIYVSD